MNFSYTYDSRGNIVSETRNGVTTTYEYDALGQLIRVNDPNDPAADSVRGTTWVYSYDRGGNILQKLAYVLSSDAQPSELRQSLIYEYTDANWKDKLTLFCNDELEYDAIGNLTDDGQWTYTWEKGRQLKSMHNANTGVTMEFKYNHKGIRTQKVKKVNGTVTETTDYILKGKLIAAMKKNTDTYYFTYDASGKPETVNFNGANYTYVKNLQGDIVGILDASGDLVVEYKYDAWGDAVSIYSASTTVDSLAFDNPFRYRGYIWDEDNNLYYLKSRYYNPKLGRFSNSDISMGKKGVLLKHNIYCYCENNPTGYLDPLGKARVSIMIFLNPEYDKLSEQIKDKEFGHVELKRDAYSYSYGRYERIYDSFGTTGEGIFVVDNWQKSVSNNKKGREIYCYELNVTDAEDVLMETYINTLLGDIEPYKVREKERKNKINCTYQYKLDTYFLLTNNCTTMTIDILQSGCGKRVPRKIRGIVSPYALYEALEELWKEGDPFILNRTINP